MAVVSHAAVASPGRPSSLQPTREKAGLATQDRAPRLGKPWAQRAATLTAHRRSERGAGQPPHVPVNTPVRTNMPVCPRHLSKSTKWALGFDLFPSAHALCRRAQGRAARGPPKLSVRVSSLGRSPAARLPANPVSGWYYLAQNPHGPSGWGPTTRGPSCRNVSCV